MEISQLSPSAKIYVDQINNYIAKGQGYQSLRIHLLKQLNQISSQNPNSDQTLVPAVTQNIRRGLLAQSSQQKSRAIDVFQDLIKHADQIIDSSINNEYFWITMNTSITYPLFNPFSKAMFDENRLRLCSIILFYYQKFQSDPTRYASAFQLYKQLKQKNFVFPEKTYIVMPKVNQFRKAKIKNEGQKSLENDRIGVTFDSIIQFVKDCDKQFNSNKLSCANTQFVRALKVKAKTLFDLSQNTQGLQLSTKQKQHAKQLYKQIRTMLKQIEKLTEQKIKQQKIKSQKQFAKQKIQQITPNKRKQGANDKQSSQKQIQKHSQKKIQSIVEQNNLLDDFISTPQVISTPKKFQIPFKKQQTSLLDDENIKCNDDNDFTQFISEVSSIKKPTQSSQKQILNDGFKPIKKPPKPKQIANNQYLDQLIDTVQSSLTPKKSVSHKQAQQTKIQKSTFSKKSIHSKHSIHSEESDRAVNIIKADPSKLIQQNQNILDFQNAQHFSKLQIINNYIDPNSYGQIPMDIDFSDSSSHQSGGSNRVKFDIPKNNLFQHDNKNQPYDKTFLTPKKQTSCQQGNDDLQKGIEKLSLSANINKLQGKQQQLIPNYNFGILADTRQVKAYDYNKFQNNKIEHQSISNVSEQEQKKITLTPQCKKNKQQTQSLNEISPTDMKFNSQKKKQAGNELLQQEWDGDDDFGCYQQIPQALMVQQIQIGSQKKVQGKDEKNLNEDSPQKGGLFETEEETVPNNEPLL